jgi:hypothetical protein
MRLQFCIRQLLLISWWWCGVHRVDWLPGWAGRGSLDRRMDGRTHALAIHTCACERKTLVRPCLVLKKICKIFQISRHIKSLDACIKY